jgi:hypothetical protein
MVREELLLQEIFTSTLSPMERARILRGAAVAATVMARSLYDEIDRSTK